MWWGSHVDVLVQGDDADSFYHMHPQGGPFRQPYDPALSEETAEGVQAYRHKRSSLQVARLTLEDGRLACDRDQPLTSSSNPAPERCDAYRVYCARVVMGFLARHPLS